jgi:hypothetical protein
MPIFLNFLDQGYLYYYDYSICIPYNIHQDVPTTHPPAPTSDYITVRIDLGCPSIDSSSSSTTIGTGPARKSVFRPESLLVQLLHPLAPYIPIGSLVSTCESIRFGLAENTAGNCKDRSSSPTFLFARVAYRNTHIDSYTYTYTDASIIHDPTNRSPLRLDTASFYPLPYPQRPNGANHLSYPLTEIHVSNPQGYREEYQEVST